MASGFASPYFAFKGAAIDKRDWDQHFSIDLLVKDQTLMLEEGGRAQGARCPAWPPSARCSSPPAPRASARRTSRR